MSLSQKQSIGHIDNDIGSEKGPKIDTEILAHLLHNLKTSHLSPGNLLHPLAKGQTCNNLCSIECMAVY